MMKLVTQRDLIRTVYRRWVQRYPASSTKDYFDKHRISDQLAKIDPMRATAEEVEAIIGNDRWTHTMCSNCGMAFDLVVQIHNSAALCPSCVREAVSLIGPPVVLESPPPPVREPNPYDEDDLGPEYAA